MNAPIPIVTDNSVEESTTNYGFDEVAGYFLTYSKFGKLVFSIAQRGIVKVHPKYPNKETYTKAEMRELYELHGVPGSYLMVFDMDTRVLSQKELWALYQEHDDYQEMLDNYGEDYDFYQH